MADRARPRAAGAKRRVFLIAVVALALALEGMGAGWALERAGAKDAAPLQPARLSAQDKDDIKRIEDYLGRLDTIEARFVQIASNGDYAEGTLYLDRPDKLRVKYDPPVPIEIIAARGTLVYFDSKLKQVSYVSASSTPAGFLLADKIAFDGEAMVTAVERGQGTIQLTLRRRADPREGSLTLVFSERPLILRKWLVEDAQGIQTGVTLIDTRFGVSLKPELFEFRDPNFFGSETPR